MKPPFESKPCSKLSTRVHDCSSGSPILPLLFRVSDAEAHAVFDVVVDDEVEFLTGEAIVLRQNSVDFIDQWLARFRINRID